MVIFLDILIILNIFVDYFLLLSCSTILKETVPKRKIIVGALVGGFFSLVIVFPNLNFLLNILIKIVFAAILILITFGFKSKQIFIKRFLIFFAENLIFIGVMFFIWNFISPPGMLYKNGFTYIAISPVILLIGSLISYFVSCVFNLIMARRVDCKKIYPIEVSFNEKKLVLNALYDSGNCLIEPFSGKPVCVCEYEKIVKLFSLEFASFFDDFFNNYEKISNLNLKKTIKLIPCDTVSGFSVLPAFLPQSFFVLNLGSEKKYYDCYVAVTKKKISDGEYEAIIGDFN